MKKLTKFALIGIIISLLIIICKETTFSKVAATIGLCIFLYILIASLKERKK